MTDRREGLTGLEWAVLERFLEKSPVTPLRSNIVPHEIDVVKRAFSPIGFLTEFVASEKLKLFPDGVCLRWMKVGAWVNAQRTHVGFLVYVDDGSLNAIEGYTYCGEDWPPYVESFELYNAP